MNDKRRHKLKQAVKNIDDARNIIDSVCDSESDSFDNLPDNFQECERGESMQDAINIMEDASKLLEDAVEMLQSLAS